MIPYSVYIAPSILVNHPPPFVWWDPILHGVTPYILAPVFIAVRESTWLGAWRTRRLRSELPLISTPLLVVVVVVAALLQMSLKILLKSRAWCRDAVFNPVIYRRRVLFSIRWCFSTGNTKTLCRKSASEQNVCLGLVQWCGCDIGSQ